MSGHCIESEDFVIVVDKWDGAFLRRPGCKPHYFFLTHLHADHIQGLTSTWSRNIYTSPLNAWLLPMRRNVKQVLLKEVELNVTHTIRKSNNEVAFQFTLLDANHCPGAVMFLFQGKFGNILYTGDFRYTPAILENPILSPIIRNKELNVLYLDNTYAAPTCKFPTREEAMKQVLKIIDENPDSKILIGLRQLGKEEVLREIALHLNEKVCVSNQRLQILAKLEYEDVFTTDVTQSRIHAVELHTITQRHCQESSKTVSIKLTSMYECANADKQRGNIYAVPYSDHSSHTELKEFVDHLRPLQLHPIVIPKISKVARDAGPWHKMSAVNCVVPDEILQFCGPASENQTPPVPPNMAPLMHIKYHTAPKPAGPEKGSTSLTYIDEGMSIVPFDSIGSHLTNNNKARKNIKANWTRLAPKLLGPKGIEYESSPEKTPELMQDSISMPKKVDDCSSEVLGPTNNKDDVSCVPSVIETSVGGSDVLMEVPLSDDELDMPSSASELVRRLNLTANQSVNGVGGEDRKSECSSEITDLCEEPGSVRVTRNRSKCESPAKVVNDSVSDIFSNKRTTRSQTCSSSVVSVPVLSRPRTRLSHSSDVDSHVNNDSPRKAPVVRKSLRNSPNAKGLSPASGKSDKNGLGRKSVSLESLSTRSSSAEKKKTAKKLKDSDIFLSPGSPTKKLTKAAVESKSAASRIAERRPPSIDNVPKETKEPAVEVINLEEEKQTQNDTSDISVIEASNAVCEESVNVNVGSAVQTVGTSSSALDLPTIGAPSENCGETAPVPKKTLNGNVLLSSFNGIHINSPGRKKVPLSCDWEAAQKIQEKETAQALEALANLDEMKGFKTRNVANRSGADPVRRLSADNIPKSLVKKPVSPGIRRRTESILSSMASTFSQQPASKDVANTSKAVSSVEGITPLVSQKVTRSPRKSPLKFVKKIVGALKVKEPQLAATPSEQSTTSGSSSEVKLEEIEEVLQNADTEDLPSSVSHVESAAPVVLTKLESGVSDLEAAGEQQSGSDSQEAPVESALNQGLFLTDETLVSASENRDVKPQRRTYYKKQTEVNVDLMKLKMDFAMSRKGPKRLSLPSRLSLLRKDVSSSLRQESSPFQSKEKVQDWKKKISLHLRKSPQRRYKFKSPNKLRENAKRTLASILRSGRSLNNSQGYQGDVEDCTELSQPTSETKENSGYLADNEGAIESSQPQASQTSQASSVSPVQRQTRSSLQSNHSDSSVSQDSKVGILNEVRRSSRLSKEDVNSSQAPGKPAKSLSRNSLKEQNPKNSKGTKIDANSLQKKTAMLPPTLKNNPGKGDSASEAARFSDRLSERARMITSKAAENVLAQKSPNILSLMADAFKNNTVPFETPSTANILSSMAENFKKLDEGTRVSPSLSIQLVSSKPAVSCRPARDKNSTDWGVQITRVDGASSNSQASSQNSSPIGHVRNIIPKSLSIEIIPDSDPAGVAPRKGPSPPTVTICPEVIDLASDPSQGSGSQSSIHSMSMSPAPRRLPQGAVRWPQVPKTEILSPPQAVWKEKRGSAQTGEKVIIDIQTQEDPQKVPHCPVHCTCGAASRQGTCMGTMRNLIEADADCLYEVPLSPEDFEDSGAMLALGRGWIESCFDDPDDRDEFFQSYEDILPTVSDFKQRRTKPLPAPGTTRTQEVQPGAAPPHVRRVLSVASPKPAVPQVKPKPTAAATAAASSSASAPTTAQRQPQTVVKKLAESTSQPRTTATSQRAREAVEPPKKGPSSAALLKEIEKKIIAYNDEQSKKKSVPSRRSSAQSTSSTNSASRSRSSHPLSPIAPLPPKGKSNNVPPAAPKRKLPSPNSSNDSKEKKQKLNTSSSGSESPESKKSRSKELERLSIDIGKNNANKRYRVSVRRSLDHLMTRQKLRSDRRVKASSSRRS